MSLELALAEIAQLNPCEKVPYTRIAKKYGVVRSTLTRRHRAETRPRNEVSTEQQNLNPQQEKDLVGYIEELSERRLQPTRQMIRNFMSSVAQKEVSESAVTRFINKHHDQLTSQWNSAMDSVRHNADSAAKYEQYFKLLHDKIQEYDVEAAHTYNMDEKGFMTGIIGRSKRVFSKRKFDKGEVRASLQDGNRDWVTVIACVCADGGVLPPGVIYATAGKAIQSSWVKDIDPRKHSVHFTTSPTGWSNNDIGLAWLEQVFDRYTKAKARRKWRLLILDGHGSHVTMDFITYCDDNKILLCILPPHSTHTLQPLDVVCFKPLSSSYKHYLTIFTHESQGLLPVKKSDFFSLFWKAWVATFTEEIVLRSFYITGIAPLNPSIIVNKFAHEDSEDSSEASSGTSVYSGKDWLKIESLVRNISTDQSSKDTRKILRSLHHISIQNELLHNEIVGLRTSLQQKKKHSKKSYPLPLQQRQEYHGGAVFWSPSKRREAEHRYNVVQRLNMEEKLRKADEREVAAARRLVKEKEKEQRRVAREAAAEVRRKEKEERAKGVAERKAEQQRQKEERDAAKAIELPQKSKRKASQAAGSKKRQKRVNIDDVVVAAPTPPPPSLPHKTTSRGRNVKLPARFEQHIFFASS
jgi:hypothetical protein